MIALSKSNMLRALAIGAFVVAVAAFLGWFAQDLDTNNMGGPIIHETGAHEMPRRIAGSNGSSHESTIGVITGRICDSQRRPLASGWVCVDEIRSTVNDDGTFEIDTSARATTLVAGAPGFQERVLTLPGTPGTCRLGDITLNPDGALWISGSVIGPSRSPEAGARVQVLAPRPKTVRGGLLTTAADLARPSRAPRILAECESDANGRFAVAVHSIASGFQVEAKTDSGRGTVYVSRSHLEDVLIELEPVSPLRGRVCDPRSTPLSGVKVAVMPNAVHGDARAFEAEAWNECSVTDESGYFALPVPDSELLVSVPFGDHGRIFMAAHAGGERTLEIVVPDEIEFGGRVVDDATDEPVTGASLQLLFRVGEQAALISAKSDDQGHLRTIIPQRGTIAQLSLTSESHATLTLSDTRLLPTEALEKNLVGCSVETTCFRVSSGSSLVGRVILKNEMTPPPLELEIQGAGGSARRRVRCDARGEFSVSHMAEGPLTLRCLTEGYFVEADSRVIHHEASHVKTREVLIGSGRAIVGRVIDHLGAPCANTRIALQHEDHSGTALHLATYSGKDGTFRFRTAPTDVELEIFAGSTATARPMGYVNVPDGPEEHRMPDVILFPLASISGTITDEEGNSVSGAQIVPIGVQAFSRAKNKIKTNPDDGRFTLTRLQTEKQLRFVVGAAGFQSSLLTVEKLQPGEDRKNLEVTLVKGNELRGIVTDAFGNAVRDADITVNWSPSPEDQVDLALLKSAFCTSRTRSAADGSFLLDRLPPNTGYRIRVGAPHLGGILRVAIAGTSEIAIQFPKPDDSSNQRR